LVRYEKTFRFTPVLLAVILLGGGMLLFTNGWLREGPEEGWVPVNEEMRQLLLQSEPRVESKPVSPPVAEPKQVESAAAAHKQPLQAAEAKADKQLAKEAAKPVQPLALNTATAKQLEGLPGVGPGIAKAIVEQRARQGGRFQSVEQLLEVKGIGDKLLQKIKPHVVLE
jgi:competence protein ComEA